MKVFLESPLYFFKKNNTKPLETGQSKIWASARKKLWMTAYFPFRILWGCECHKTELKGAPTAQGIKLSDLYQQNAEMGWTIGYRCDSSSTCHQQSSFFPCLSCFSMVSVHPRACFSPGGKMATEVSELIVAYPSSQKERSILSSNSLKDWESIFSRSPSPESQPWHFIGLNWVICSFLSQSQWLGEHPLLIDRDGSYFLIGLSLHWVICQLSSEHLGWGKHRSGYCCGRREMDMEGMTNDIYYIV